MLAKRIIPCLDVRNGKVVKGVNFEGIKDVGDPVECAYAYNQQGADEIVFYDITASYEGRGVMLDVVRETAKKVFVPLTVGGGIRTEERIRRYLDLGVGRCILGTIAVKDFAFTERMAKKYGDRIAVGVDARDGFVAVSGWKELSAERGVDFCRRLRDAGVKTVIYTDISRDGAEQGTNLDLYRELAEIEGLDITASGGVSSIEELRELQTLGTKAAILGKALYTGRLDLKTVMEEVGTC